MVFIVSINVHGMPINLGKQGFISLLYKSIAGLGNPAHFCHQSYLQQSQIYVIINIKVFLMVCCTKV